MNADINSDGVTGCDIAIAIATQGINGSLGSQAEDNILEKKHDDVMDIMDRSDEYQRNDDNSNDQEKYVGPSVGDDSWEEHGCILWDLATSRTHAELMVHYCPVTQLNAI